ncbi:hypothetical protein PCE1_001152 [Barthelona sp. PCE]
MNQSGTKKQRTEEKYDESCVFNEFSKLIGDAGSEKPRSRGKSKKSKGSSTIVQKPLSNDAGYIPVECKKPKIKILTFPEGPRVTEYQLTVLANKLIDGEHKQHRVKDFIPNNDVLSLRLQNPVSIPGRNRETLQRKEAPKLIRRNDTKTELT